jgi:inorganic pyrophosphatase
VLVFGDKVAGYANYGRNRARSLHFEGEIYELYLRPEFQGLGFGRRLFTSARRDLMQSGLKSMVIWRCPTTTGDGILPRARRPDGGALLGEVRAEVARQGRFRLDQLKPSSLLWLISATRVRLSREIDTTFRTALFELSLLHCGLNRRYWRRSGAPNAKRSPDMRIDAIPIGVNPPHDVNVIVEVPLAASRSNTRWTRKPARWWSTASSIRRCAIPAITASSRTRCPATATLRRAGRQYPRDRAGRRDERAPVGVLLMEDEAGGDEKIIAVPSSKLTQRYDKVRTYSDLPDITLQQIQHFFEHYKDLEPANG